MALLRNDLDHVNNNYLGWAKQTGMVAANTAFFHASVRSRQSLGECWSSRRGWANHYFHDHRQRQDVLSWCLSNNSLWLHLSAFLVSNSSLRPFRSADEIISSSALLTCLGCFCPAGRNGLNLAACSETAMGGSCV
ncbi:hypothetical protein HPP92_004301 [Vanilla planifolia]|uniref:Uncharacterized protein n=1 Tax=Vanilla planifolia TaxID=51239 RepID=A0A835RW29_VANPL|nr:hypothetical protein HPP92_004301 [Vanilla planifolia]